MSENPQPYSCLPRISTLLYHRIDTTQSDPWGICVSAANFEEHIQFLTYNFRVINSRELINQISAGRVEDGSFCVTFDDGYADNYLNAMPILEKYNCPATFFISTSFIGGTVSFWWEELQMIFLHSIKLPTRLSLDINGKSYPFFLEERELTEEHLLRHYHWKWYESPPTDRCIVFLKIWRELRSLLNSEIEEQMCFLRAWANLSDNGNIGPLPLHEQQLKELLKNNLVTIGMHTHSHPDLAGREKSFQVDEILSCKKNLSTIYNIECDSLSYPFGSYDNNTMEVLSMLKIKAGFTTCAASINAYSNPACLGRFQVSNKGSSFLRHQLNI